MDKRITIKAMTELARRDTHRPIRVESVRISRIKRKGNQTMHVSFFCYSYDMGKDGDLKLGRVYRYAIYHGDRFVGGGIID